MVVCTQSADSIARIALGKKNVAISKLQVMVEQFKLDPMVSSPVREAFIVTDRDLRNKKFRDMFLEAAKAKHPNVKIFYYSFKPNSDIEVGNGIDGVLIKANAEMLNKTIYGAVGEVTNKAPILSSSDVIMENEKKFVPTFDPMFEDKGDAVVEPEPEPIQPEEPEVLTVEETVEEAPVEVPEELLGSELVERIHGCERVKDVNIFMREVNATKVVRDIMKSNKQYIVIEDKLKVLQEKITSIFLDPTIKTTSEKLERIKALRYDKRNYCMEKNTIIEQRVGEIIDTVVEQTKKSLDKRAAELDRAIVAVGTKPIKELSSARLAGITEERANLLLELAVMDGEIASISEKVNDLALDVTSEMAESTESLTNNPLLDAKLRLHKQSIVPDNMIEKSVHILCTADRASEEFKEARRQILLLKAKLYKVLECDQETINALTEAIRFLKANNVEDTIIAQTLIKKSLRVFVARKGCGRTAIPYTLSALKSRENANVLYMDLTGEAKLADYGQTPITYEDWYENRYQKEFCVVAGSISDTPEAVQRLNVALTKAAEYYRVINLVVSPEQVELIKTIAPDVLAINYMMTPLTDDLDFYKDFITETTYDNVAQRVILNRCDIDITPVIDRLELMEKDDIEIKTIPFISALVDCSLNKVQPQYLEVVQDGLREVRKSC